MKTLLSVENLGVTLNSHKVLSDINFELNVDENLAVIGPNGAGKSILFKALLGLIPYSGKVTWRKGVKIGYVPQKVLLEDDLPLTTEEFFELKNVTKQQVIKLLTAVGFGEDFPHKGHLKDHILKRKMGNLSGGELQRVLIAWALVGNPEVLLFDEPTSGVDVNTEGTIYELLKRLQLEKKIAIILISHDLNVVYQFSTKVVCLNKEMVCYGSPREVLDKDSLAKLYTGEVGIYQHNHKND